jgi:hypothetical protein
MDALAALPVALCELNGTFQSTDGRTAKLLKCGLQKSIGDTQGPGRFKCGTRDQKTPNLWCETFFSYLKLPSPAITQVKGKMNRKKSPQRRREWIHWKSE